MVLLLVLRASRSPVVGGDRCADSAGVQDDSRGDAAWPRVTVQLPIYNERYVAPRLLAAVLDFDYPAERLERRKLATGSPTDARCRVSAVFILAPVLGNGNCYARQLQGPTKEIGGRMKQSLPLVTSLLAVVLLAPAAEGQGPPQEIPELDWISAARALDQANPDSLHPVARKQISEQSEKFRATFVSAASNGLREGRLPPEEFCTVKGIGAGVALLGPVTYGEFGSGLLLAEVAVVATVTNITPGFDGSAWVESLLELGDAVALHGRSPIPDYVLVPVQRVVAEDRVFCGGYGAEFDPVIGTRVVVLGPWVQGVVPVGPGPGMSAMFATVQKDGESLRWSHSSTGPNNLVDLQARVEEAVHGNLFSLTSHLVNQEERSKERRKFGVEWKQRRRRGCRLIAVDEGSGEQTEICISSNATAAAKARFEKAWRRQCADGGEDPFVERLSGDERTRTNVCER